MEVENRTLANWGYGSPLQSIKDMFNNFEMIKYLVIGNLKKSHRNMLLGYLWWLITPILWVATYWLLVSVIFHRGKPFYPLFLSCAILPWRAFAVSIGQSITCISGQGKIIKQISFPKGVLPVSVVLTNSVHLLISMVVLIGIALLYGIVPDQNIIFLPSIIFIQILFTLGLSFLFSVIGLYFIDIQNMLQFILRVWLYLSPSLYDIDRIPEKFRDIFMLNPFAPIFISYRKVIMYGAPPDFNSLMIAFFISVLTLSLGLFIFSRIEHKMAKLI